MNFLSSFQKRSKPFWIIVGFELIGVVGILDFLTGYEFAFSLFYLIPISLVTWRTSRRLGIVASLASASVWLITDMAAGHSYSHPVFYAWNTFMGFGFFVIVSLLLSTLRRTLEHERELAHTDYLTGAENSRSFFVLAQMEVDRTQRYKHPFTLVYIDLDNFKIVNDQFGHSVGDRVLRTVVSSTRKYLRKTDVVARLGGDEFALLLPETNQESARIALSKIQSDLLEEMRQGHWPITFSIGVLTCSAAPQTTDALVSLADELMYSVKRNGKNAIKYSIYTG